MSLLESCLFDVRDSLLLESRVASLSNGSFKGGYGPNQEGVRKKKVEKNVNIAEKIDQDILDFGVNESGIPAKRVSSDRDNDGCHPPSNKSLNATNLFNRRCHQAEGSSESMKIRKTVEIHSLKKEFQIANNCKSRSFFVVQICKIPSCTCVNFNKNGHKVFCKHIIFVLVVVLGVSQEILKESRFIDDDNLKTIFSKPVSHSFLLPPKNVLRKDKHDLKKILQKHPGYNKPQETKLHHKESRSAKCQGRGCNNIFTAGTLCLKVEGALTVPPKRDEAVEQRFYFCPQKQCLANPPHWSNVKYPHFLQQVGAFLIVS